MSGIQNTRRKLGTRVGGYLLIEHIGAGGMGSVYRARQVSSGAEVALKLLDISQATPRVLIERMQREASLSSRLDHPNLVRLYGFGDSDHCAYVAMELIRGRTLSDELKSGPIATERAMRISRGIASGLAAVHAAGLVHRDLKPANLMLSGGGATEEVKILDFGIVGSIGASIAPLTAESAILGTPTYMAPEQFESASVAPAADLYALGAVIYHMITGHPPFEGTFREIAAQHMFASPQPAPVAGGLGALAHRLLEKRAEARPLSADEVLAELTRISSPARAIKKRSIAWKTLSSCAATAAVALLAGAATARTIVERPAIEESALPVAPTLVRGSDLLSDARDDAFHDQLTPAEVSMLQKRIDQVSTLLDRARNALPSHRIAKLKTEHARLAEMARPEIGQLGRDGVLVRLDAIKAELEKARATASRRS